MTRNLARWPLLLVGIAALTAAVVHLVDSDSDRSDARALVLGLAAVLIGAGIVLVAQGHPAPVPPGSDDPDTPTSSGDTPGDTP